MSLDKLSLVVLRRLLVPSHGQNPLHELLEVLELHVEMLTGRENGLFIASSALPADERPGLRHGHEAQLYHGRGSYFGKFKILQ